MNRSKNPSSVSFSFPVAVLLVDLSVLAATPEHAVRPRGNALFLRGVVVVREEVVLVRGREVDRTLLEAGEDVARPIFDLEDKIPMIVATDILTALFSSYL